MALAKEVQDKINQIANHPEALNSAREALKLEGELIASIQNHMASPKMEKAKAMKEITDLQEVNAALQTAVPASTPGV